MIDFSSADPGALAQAMEVAKLVRAGGGRAHFVGGCVRDALLGRPLVDFDIEVFGIEADALRERLDTAFDLDLVGESFGVLKLRGAPIDVSLPRRESKSGRGHRGFSVQSDPGLSEREAAARRDFTVNAMAWDPLAERLVDPYDGRADLERGVLRHTSERFVDDPLRVLRAAQFAARFEWDVAPETVELCRRIEPEGLAVERIEGEWRKLILRGQRPGLGLHFLADCGWIRFFPELDQLRGCLQDPEWHPEGDVFVHTAHVLDAFAADRIQDEEEDWIVGLGCLCHDLGKPATTVFVDGRWRSPGHEPAGAQPTRDLLARLSRRADLADRVVPLVEHHLKPRQLHEAGAGDAAVRRLARKVRIDRLVRVARADALGRPPLVGTEDPAGEWLLERARALEVAARAPQPWIQGRHLIQRGLEPGPSFGPLLEAWFERQLEGEFRDLEHALKTLDQEIGRT